MLQELVRPFTGLQDYTLNSENQSAFVTFSRHDDAKIALAGNENSNI